MKTKLLIAALLFFSSIAPAHAAVGDAAVPATCASVDAAAFLTIQPGSGVEWTIHNVWWESSVAVSRYDGTNAMAGVPFGGPNALIGVFIHVTNGNYIRVENTDGSAQRICFDGVVTKE